MKLFCVSSSHWDLTQRHLYVEEALLLLSGLLTFLITLVPVIDKCLSFLSSFIYLAVLGVSCGIRDLVSWIGMEPGPLHWECEVLAPGPPGKSLISLFWLKNTSLWLWNYSFILMIKTILWGLNTTSECLGRPLLEKRPVSIFFCKDTFLL